MHFMNPQRARHMGAEAEPPLVKLGPGSAIEKGDGSEASGYATPDFGPFECENCTHFAPPNSCNHPTVQSDPEVNGQVDPEGCCNYFKSAHNESQAEEHGESDALHESAER